MVQLLRYIFLFACLMLSACDNGEPVSLGEQNVMPEKELPVWLDGTVNMTPQEWLIMRSQPGSQDTTAVPINEQNAVGLLIDQASARFDESHRMVANRAAQLQDMLAEHDIHEDAISLMQWFVDLPATQHPHSFSAMCQYYYNMRSQGYSQQEVGQALLKM